MNNKKRTIIIIDVKDKSSIYRLESALRGYKNADIIIPQHCIYNVWKLNDIFSISFLAKQKAAHLYPKLSNLLLARKVKCSEKTKQTISIAILIWMKINCKIHIITDVKEMKDAVETQYLEGIIVKQI